MAFPSAVTVLAGTGTGGSAASLAADDGSYFTVASGFLTAPSWHASFAGVPAGASDLRVAYDGRASRSCTLTLAIWNWGSGAWTTLEQRSLGTSDASIADLAPPGAASSYVGPGGEVRVRATCSVFTFSSYSSSGDLVSLTYAS